VKAFCIFLLSVGKLSGRKGCAFSVIFTREAFTMIGIICSLLAGAAMSIQGVFNTRLGERIGLYEANLLVQGIAFGLSAAAVLLLGKGSFAALAHTNRLYLLGGVLGMVITLTVMLAMKGLGPTVAVCIILIAQLVTAALIDAFGWFGTAQTVFGWQKYAGTRADDWRSDAI
jgi:transporter family-2 protein